MSSKCSDLVVQTISADTLAENDKIAGSFASLAHYVLSSHEDFLRNLSFRIL